MSLEGGSGCAAGERTLLIPCKASRVSSARVFYLADRLRPRAPSSVDPAHRDTHIRRSLAPSRARGANVPGAARPSLCVRICVNVTSCGAQEDLLASYKGNYPGEVPYCSATLVPHLEEKIGSECMDLVKVEKEWLEDRRSRIYKVTTSLGHLQNRIGRGNVHPGAKTPQYSDRSSTTSFDARARGHRRCGDREFCSCTTFEKKSGSLCTKCFFCGACQRCSLVPNCRTHQTIEPQYSYFGELVTEVL